MLSNHVHIVAKATGVFEENHSVLGADGKIITALETNIVYTSSKNVLSYIKIIVYKGSLFERILSKKGKLVKVEGAMCTFNKDSFGKRILEVYISPKYIKELPSEIKQKNTIRIKGEIQDKVIFKERTNGRFVAEVKVKVVMDSGDINYIPVVAFDEEAKLIKQAKPGQKISFKGRIHSRNYNFKYENKGEKNESIRTALEVCVHEMDIEVEQEQEQEIDEEFNEEQLIKFLKGRMELRYNSTIIYSLSGMVSKRGCKNEEIGDKVIKFNSK